MKRKILAIDGGGIRGAMPAAFLSEIEQTTSKRVVDYFDLIVGTSIGGIVALGVSSGLPASTILAFFEQQSEKIFRRNSFGLHTPKYRSEPLRNLLSEFFGDRILGDCVARTVVPAFDRDRADVHVFKTSHHPKLATDWQWKIVDVALATAAAPAYFSAHEGKNGESLIDGGIWANNPTGLAVVEAIAILGFPSDDLYVLSLGCGESLLSLPPKAGKLDFLWNPEKLFLLGQSRASMGTAKLLTRHSDDKPRVFRVTQTIAPEEDRLDAVRQLTKWKALGSQMAREKGPLVSAIFLDKPCERFVPFHPQQVQQQAT